MHITERNFNSFHLGDNVYELADGLVPEIAERLEVPLSNEPNSEELGVLVGKIGANKVLRSNEEVTAIDRDTQVDLVERSGVQEPLNRSLWTPEIPGPVGETVVMTGAVANWMDRGLRVVVDDIMNDAVSPSPRIITAAGTRVMDSPTEQGNVLVQNFVREHDRYPIEAEYARDYTTHSLQVATGIEAENFSADTSKGDELARLLFIQYPELLNSKITFARVANAGVQLAVQMRKAAREFNQDFDNDQSNPQVFVLTDSFPLAKTNDQEADPKNFQKAGTALRQVALTAKMLHEAAGGE